MNHLFQRSWRSLIPSARGLRRHGSLYNQQSCKYTFISKRGSATDICYYHLCDCIVFTFRETFERGLKLPCKLVHPLLLPDPDLKARPTKSSYEEQSDKEGRPGDSLTVAGPAIFSEAYSNLSSSIIGQIKHLSDSYWQWRSPNSCYMAPSCFQNLRPVK